jgi:putative membrane protein
VNALSLPLAHTGAGGVAPLQLAPALIVAVLYWRRARTLAGTARAVPVWRQGCFYGAVALMVGTLASPVGHIADELFWVHMAEHLVLSDGGALLLVLGLTGPLLAPVLRLPVLGRLKALAHPVPALLLWALNLFLWHGPVLHEAAVRGEVVHALQHMLFVGFGVNLWMALLGPLPRPAWFGTLATLGFIIAVRLIGAVLANVLLFGGDAFYDVYAGGERLYGISPQADQNAAGAVMMVWESILTICLFGWLFLRAAREGEERQELLDLAGARGAVLTDRRAARAVAAGRGEDLRRRLEERGG